MRKKVIRILLTTAGALLLGAVAFGGWFFYQMRDLKTIETASISDSLYVLQGNIGNLYLMKSNDGFIAFDAADNVKKIIDGCQSLGIDPLSVHTVFLTHSDADHVNGLPAFPNATVYLPREEVPLLKETKYRHFLGMGFKNNLPVSQYQTISDGDSITIGGISIHAIATPGHTIGSTCYRVGESLFTGDLCIIVDGHIKPMLKIFTEDMSLDSISITKIARMNNIKKIYTMHTGYSMDIGKLFSKWSRSVMN